MYSVFYIYNHLDVFKNKKEAIREFLNGCFPDYFEDNATEDRIITGGNVKHPTFKYSILGKTFAEVEMFLMSEDEFYWYDTFFKIFEESDLCKYVICDTVFWH